MDRQKIYLLAEVTVLPEFPDDVKGALKQALIPTLQEAGCEGTFETSQEANRIGWSSLRSFPLRRHISFHLEQDYMKRLFARETAWRPPRQSSCVVCLSLLECPYRPLNCKISAIYLLDT
jgi:hypothetical protein